MHDTSYTPADLRSTLGGSIVHDEEIGILQDIQDDKTIRMHLPHHAALTRGTRLGVDYGPVITLLDTVSGVTALHGLGYRESTATLDLRIDFLEPANPGQDVVAEARVSQVFGSFAHGSVLIEAEAWTAADGKKVAKATGRFFRKDLPQLTNQHGYLSDHLMDNYQDYLSFMGYRPLGNGALLLPFRIGIIGNGALPSLHGGVLAAHLLESARAVMADTPTPNPATAHFTFERYGKSQDVIATAMATKPGRSVSFVQAKSTQPGLNQPIASASFTFVA